LARIRTGTLAEDVALSADGRRLWVALGHGGLKILDTQSLRLDDYPSVGCPKRLALARGMARLFVAYQCGGPGGRAGHDALEIIDEPTRRSVLARSGLPLVGSYLAVSPDEQVLWADAHDACISAAYDHIGCPAVPSMVIHALRPTTLELLTSFALPPDRSDSFPVFVPDGSRVIVGASGVSVLNARLGQVEEHFPGDSVAEAAFSPDSRALVVGFTNQRGLMIARVHDRLDARRIDGIGSYWPGDGSSADVVGGMHAVQTEGIVFRPGRLGQAFAFDGQRSTMHFGNRLEVDIHREPATYAAWVRSAAPERTMTLLSRPGHAGWEIRLLAGGRLAFCFSVAAGALACDRGGVSASVPMTQGWHHIAVVRDATSLKLYVDGRLVADHSLAGYANPVVANDDPAPITRLGADIDGTSRFAGLVDEVALFRRALTAGDIAELMSATTLKR